MRRGFRHASLLKRGACRVHVAAGIETTLTAPHHQRDIHKCDRHVRLHAGVHQRAHARRDDPVHIRREPGQARIIRCDAIAQSFDDPPQNVR
jgi:hypothetical protein